MLRFGHVNQVHIVGLSPRAGTTLAKELMAYYLSFDATCPHERSVFFAPDVPVESYLSKSPWELHSSLRALKYNRKLRVICMVRDPRDVISSRHGSDPTKYWTSLKFMQSFTHLKQASQNERFLIVKYENLASQPNDTLRQISDFISIDKRGMEIDEFNLSKTVSDASNFALNGIRPIDTSSIGSWKDNLPRVREQIDRFGPISNELIDLGYESDDSWLQLLREVKPFAATHVHNAKKAPHLLRRLRSGPIKMLEAPGAA